MAVVVVAAVAKICPFAVSPLRARTLAAVAVVVVADETF